MNKKTKQLMATLALLVLIILQTVLSLPRHNQFSASASDDSLNGHYLWSRNRSLENSADWRARPHR